MRLILILLLVSCGPILMARDWITPPIEIRIEGSPQIPTHVRYMVRKLYGLSYEQLSEGQTDVRGFIHFPATTFKSGGWLGFEFNWSVDGKAPRTLIFELRTKKDGKKDGYNKIRFGDGKAFYMLGDEQGGDCEDLFVKTEEDGKVVITFTRPDNYAPCEQETALAQINNIGNREINDGKLNYYKFDDDLKMGQEFASQLGQSGENPELMDPMVNRYVTNLVKRIGKASDMPDLEFKVKVIDADVLNAFAVPGGYIWVYRGLITNTETEAELAGVIAHEIAHVTSRHGTEGVTSALNKTAVAMAAGAIAEEAAKDQNMLVKQILQTVIGGGTQYWIIGGTRKNEAEADKLGAQYAWKAGYDPHGIATLFQRWADNKGKQSRLDKLFSDHPSDEDRVAATLREIDYFLPPKQNLIVSSPEYLAVKKQLQKLPPPKQSGEVAGNALFGAFTRVNENILSQELGSWLDEQEKKEK